MKRIRFAVMLASLCSILIFSSGCAALFLLGIGGAGGYLIKKGEGEDRRSNSLVEPADRNHASSIEDENGRQLAWTTGGTSR